MKNLKNSNKTKALLFTSLLFVFSSCDSTPIINGDKPFIVNQIDELSNGMCEYYGDVEARWDATGFSGRPSIVLPKRMYNIGDTVILKK